MLDADIVSLVGAGIGSLALGFGCGLLITTLKRAFDLV